MEEEEFEILLPEEPEEGASQDASPDGSEVKQLSSRHELERGRAGA